MAHDSNYKKRDYKRVPRTVVYDPKKHCGRTANDGHPCTMTKGAQTDHPGEGYCKFHGGNNGSKVSRLYSHLKRKATTEALEKVREEVEDPMDLRPELELLRAMVLEFHDRYEEFKEAMITFHVSFSEPVTTLLKDESPLNWAKAIYALRASVNQRPVQVIDVAFSSVIVDRIGRMVERIHKMKTDSALTPDMVRKYRDALVLVVMEECTPEQATRIAEKMEKL